MSEREARAQAIVKAALGVAANARAGFVRDRCQDDEALAARVRALLASQEQATIIGASVAPNSLVHESATVLGETGATSAGAGNAAGLIRLGQYTVVKVLGEGGMGVVYLAQQERPKRTVALKVIRPGMLSPRMLRRFEHESAMLARLQHPGIAQVFEAATAQTSQGPQPFFAMEYVEGVALTDYADARGLGIKERLTLFVSVCDAVHHAHQKGVIHRDLKPGNILVDASGQPKILDFGIARATDADMQTATMQTSAGELVGTLPYMSPEQIAGDPAGLDTRSDVYTLGVILYQLLAGRLPHDVLEKSVPEAVRIMTQQEARGLRSVRREVPSDIATIVHKALEKDKARRYASASELAADLQRALSNQPISARPPSTMYQVSKFAQRNKALVAMVGVAVAVLLAGIAGTTYQAIEATRGRREALAQSRIASGVSTFMTDMLSSADVEATGDKDVTVREVIDIAAATLETPNEERPALVEASIRGALANSYRGIGQYERAEQQARRAFELAGKSFGPESPITIDASRVLAGVLVVQGKFDQAEPLAKQAAEVLRAKHGEGHVEAVLARSELARVYVDTGRWGEALPMLESCLATLLKIEGEQSRRTQTVMHNLGFALKSAGRFEESVAMLMRAMDASTKALGPDHPQTLFELNTLAATMQRAGRNADAAERFRDLANRRERVLGGDHPSTINALSNLGVALIADGQLAEGETLVRKCLEAYERTLGDGHPKTLITRGNLAYVLEDLGKLDEAEALYRKTLEIQRKSVGGRDPETWSTLNNMGMLLMKQDRAGEAEPLFREVIGMCEQTLPPGHYYTAIYQNNLGECLTTLGQLDEAERLLTTTLPMLEKTFKAGHPRMIKGIERLVALYVKRGEQSKAEEWKAKLPAKAGTR